MTRVIGGAAGGRRLAVPPGDGTRPTSDRAREGLFSTLVSLRRTFHGARVLDLYAGSGAVGLEALSRGAAHTLLVESDAVAGKTVRANIKAVALPGAELRAVRAERLPAEAPPAEPYDIVFLDPPYALPDADVATLLTALREGGWLASEAIVAAERATRGGTFAWPPGFEEIRSRKYGEATLWYGRAARA
ncbi:16S rRNA (guanine(966)-N(2))-methyltransferase RsmD [Yinghuangia seranimata]|uniref:16S rRNA (guanine(966)-N(2))-methyltransferase RsmD n=1 Tax=Yinghuangia seranimata TaxID=408067 RepID=UPI00248AEFD6|nr:16S rRNA (guanine(966)-N(2))-methyltransferase RsmD [Yinghuangia seranimata]MDI2129303.1 16S rRNA (guanine(966)-N(2))-methyltransferase RsmD [Yinghuangia seranimata]